MGERRKPVYTFLLRKSSKKKSNKVELFRANQWKSKCESPLDLNVRYRLRVNGKWHPPKCNEKIFFTKTQIKDILFKSINFN